MQVLGSGKRSLTPLPLGFLGKSPMVLPVIIGVGVVGASAMLGASTAAGMAKDRDKEPDDTEDSAEKETETEAEAEKDKPAWDGRCMVPREVLEQGR